MGELISDPDFCQPFTITRQTGANTGGRFQITATEVIPVTGIIRPANTKDIIMLPAGDSIKGEIVVYTTQAIYTTRAAHSGAAGVSDEVVWHGDQYKIIQVSEYSDFGFWKALAARKLGA